MGEGYHTVQSPLIRYTSHGDVMSHMGTTIENRFSVGCWKSLIFKVVITGKQAVAMYSGG